MTAPIQAQIVGNASSQQKEGEPSDIVVTGSHLRQSTFDSPIPINILGKEDLLDHGYQDLAEALSDLPSVSADINLSNNQSSTKDNGVATMELRGLGRNRTLTLIDGHRTVSDLSDSTAVNLDTIPTYFINRIEVSTGGASAAYGSDAVAGVVNIITNTKLEGLQGRVVNGVTNDGGGNTHEASLALGKTLLNDRLYVMATVTYQKQDALYATDRNWAMKSVLYDDDSNTISSPDLSSYAPGGRFLSSAGAYYYNATGLHSGFQTEVNGYEDRGDQMLISPRETWNAGGKLRYDVSDAVTFTSQLLYSHIQTDTTRASVTVTSATDFGPNDSLALGRIPYSDVYIPAVILKAAPSSGVDWRRRLSELGQLEVQNERVTVRGWAGLQGRIFGDWNWDVTYGYGRYVQDQQRINGVNYQDLQYAMNGTTIGGQIVCADATARAAGCVPVNLFGVGTISSAAAAYIRDNEWFRAVNSQNTLDGNLTGSPFSVPAGPVQLAAGFSLRRDHTATDADAVAATGDTFWQYTPVYKGTIEAAEGYVESSVPVLRDLPFVYRLGLDGAVRLATYNLSGSKTTLSYRLGGQWAPVQGVAFRATFSRAQRAPNTTELYSPLRGNVDSVTDLCSGVTAATAGAIAQNCRANSAIAAAIAANGVFKQDSTSMEVPNGGNPNLTEETAYTFTGGMVLAPVFLPGFHASVDYWDIRVNNVIDSLSASQLLYDCYSAPTGQGGSFCSTITRNSEGQITSIEQIDQNLDQLRARGIDFALSYAFTLKNIPGRFELNASETHNLQHGEWYQGSKGQLEYDNELGEIGTWKDRGRASLSWITPRLKLQWTAVYIGSALDSNDLVSTYAEAGITDPLYQHIPHYWRHDLSFSVTPSVSRPNLRFFGTIKNIFNKYGPFLPDGTESGNENNYNSDYGVTGRLFSLGLSFKF